MFSEVENAVFKGDAEKVRTLLAAGADVNMRVKRDDGTLLHESRNVKVTKELLRHGAYVDATNKYRETPLHSAVTGGCGVAVVGIVRELLNYQADVDAQDLNYNTPLNLAVKHSCKNMEVINELLKHGADINIRNRLPQHYGNCNSPLGNAMSYPGYAKLLIKYTLIKNLNTNPEELVDLQPYRDSRISYNEIRQYMEDCVLEINRMKNDQISDNLSVYEFVKRNCPCLKLLHGRKKILNRITVDYPIYQDIISDKISLTLERENLLNKLSELAIYGVNPNQNDYEHIILNPYCTLHMAKYLSNQDMKNLLNAFTQNPATKSCENEKTDVELEPSASSAKRARIN